MVKHKFGSLNITLLFLAVSLLATCITIRPTQAQQDDLPIYIIQNGDTLSSIALRFNLSTEDIQAVNELIDPNLLNIGDRIRIPGLEGISGVLTSEVVPFGTTLTSISRQNRLEPNALVRLNKYTSPAETFAGIKMIVLIQEGVQTLSPLPPLNFGQALLEMAVLNQISPWALVQRNALEATWQALPYEFIYFENNGNPDLQVALPYIEQITIESLPLVQGETLSIRLRASQPLQVVGEIASKSLHFFSENANEYISLHGISAVAEPGAYPFRLQITNEGGDSYVIEQWVLLAPGLYINDANIIVDPTTIDSDVIATEETIFEKIITPVTETRLWDGRFSIPVTAPGWIVGDFGNRRSYNNGDYLYYHTGIDYGVDVNLNVYAPASGKVVSAQEMAIRGNALILDHGWGVYTGYWHLSEFLVSVGEIVEPGQLIAYIGNTGRSAGPHLHFEMIVTGTAVNPTQWLSKSFP